MPVFDPDADDAPGSEAVTDLHGLFLCVLAPYDVISDKIASTAPGGWRMLHWPAPETWIEALAAWARARARNGGGLRKKSARTRLPDSLRRYSQWFDGPREALELCALFDEIGCGDHNARLLARHPPVRAVAVLMRSDGFDDPRVPEGWHPRLKLAEEVLLARAPEVERFPPLMRAATRLFARTTGLARKGAKVLHYRF